MRRTADELSAFYASSLGGVVRTAVSSRLAETWGDARGQDVLALGFATPFVAGFEAAARRVLAAMPVEQGAAPWPTHAQWPPARNACALVEEEALPFPSAFFDRVLIVHALEESEAPHLVLAEAARVLRPSGRLVCVAAARTGLWAWAEATPFGHGRPYSRGQLEAATRDAGLEPQAWTRALYAPPLPLVARAGALWEGAGRRFWPALSGLVLLEAAKAGFAVRPRAARRRVFVRAPAAPGLVPALGGARVFGHSEGGDAQPRGPAR